MTEEVIIDGVDVTGCFYLFKFKGFDDFNEVYTEWSCNIGGSSCENNDNCYYKQLKRLEQEKERLTRDYFKQNEWLQQQKNEIDILKQENEKLKISNSNLDSQLHITNEMMNNCNNRLQNYRSALEEIKKKAEILYYRAITDPVKREREVWNIRQKCNEVLNDK